MLQMDKLTVASASNQLVKQVSLSVNKGEWHAVAGPSGAGKSLTALSVYPDLLPSALNISSGAVLFQGEDLVRSPEKLRRHIVSRHIAYVFQDARSSFFPLLSIYKQWEDILKVQRPGLKKKERREKMEEALDVVLLPASVLKQYPSELSGGQVQRVALAVAWLTSPDLIIADEPTSALDVLTSAHIMELFQTLQKEKGCAILMISHDLREVLRFADTVSIMAEGQIVEAGRPDSVLTAPKHEVTRRLCRAVPLLRSSVKREGIQ